ncbi:MAG TPA: trigger factor, partial [Bacillota bacterium]|nr:trigger factor [Bacillota bacterium]
LSEIDIPEVMIEKQIDSMVRDFEMQLMYQGLKLEGYLDYYNKSMEEFRDGLRDEATERVRTQLTLEKVPQVEGVTASEEELDKELEEMAKRYKMEDIEKFKKSMGEDELNYIRESIIIRKTVDLLVDELTEK